MSPKQKAEIEAHAREFIDKIIAINREYGMGDHVSDEVYKNAVDGSARAVSGLVRSAP